MNVHIGLSSAVGTHHSNAQTALTLTASGKAAILREYPLYLEKPCHCTTV